MTDDRHPEELLAGYVDGTLTDKERGVVESHLSSCPRCREESALSMRAVATLRQVEDEPVPFGVMNPVTAEIRRRMERTRPRSVSQRVVWAAGGAIAAAFIGIVAIWVLPGVGARDATTMAGGGAEAASASRAPTDTTAGALAPQRVLLERTSTDYDDPALAALATRTATDARSGGPAAAPQASGDGPATREATACLAKGAGIEPQDVLVRLIEARYHGEPAYVGVYLTSPAEGQPPKSVVVWVVRADTCEFLSITSKRI
jgi:putative zinc finger protein